MHQKVHHDIKNAGENFFYEYAQGDGRILACSQGSIYEI